MNASSNFKGPSGPQILMTTKSKVGRSVPKQPWVVTSPILARFPEVVHGFTTRTAPADFQQMMAKIDIPHQNFFSLRQIHSGRVYSYRYEDTLHPPIPIPEADSIVTSEDYVVIGVRTADCVPILLYDPNEMVVSAVHAGWRGIVRGVIEETLREMVRGYGVRPLTVLAAIGPSLCRKCFEVGPEVVSLFLEKMGEDLDVADGKGDRSTLDLKEVSRMILLKGGLTEKNINVLPFCTICDNRLFYSHRKGDQEARSIAFVGLAGWLMGPDAA